MFLSPKRGSFTPFFLLPFSQALLDALVRVNKDLDRLDDLYRAMIIVEPDANVWETESRQRELNQLYMDLLGHLKCILRRIKHLENLLDEYRRQRLHFKVHLLEELTYFRTHDNMTEVRFSSYSFPLKSQIRPNSPWYHLNHSHGATFLTTFQQHFFKKMSSILKKIFFNNF